jgi:hypothetical protein
VLGQRREQTHAVQLVKPHQLDGMLDLQRT